jgi:hypothetical protein
MTKETMYRYLGRNGIITSRIKLEQIDPIPMVRLVASSGKMLTDGISVVPIITVFEEEVNNWTEIDVEGQD